MRRVDAPEWFRAALAAPREEDEVEVDGAPVHYVRWGARGRPGIVLVHGGAAHAHWWDHVAPLLTQECCVVALDLSGHGDSGRRDRYPTVDVGRGDRRGRRARGHRGTAGRRRAQHGRLGRDHRRRRARRPARRHRRARLTGPSPARRRRRPRPKAPRSARCARTRRSRPRSAASAPSPTSRRRCRTSSTTSPRTSVRKVDGGWTWKFDPRIFDRPVPTGELLRRVRCRVALFRSEHGLVTPDIGAYMYEQLGRHRARRRGPARAPPRDARPADPAGHRPPHAARRLGAQRPAAADLTGP